MRERELRSNSFPHFSTFSAHSYKYKNLNLLQQKYQQETSILAIHTAIYQELAKKPAEALSEGEKTFMQKHEQAMLAFLNS